MGVCLRKAAEWENKWYSFMLFHFLNVNLLQNKSLHVEFLDAFLAFVGVLIFFGWHLSFNLMPVMSYMHAQVYINVIFFHKKVHLRFVLWRNSKQSQHQARILSNYVTFLVFHYFCLFHFSSFFLCNRELCLWSLNWLWFFFGWQDKVSQIS